MTSRRSYRHALSHQETMDILQDECGSKSDPAVFAHFASLVQERPDLVAASTSRH
jgi:HD-GYP domain-containing protein (c-di-GMP phosphodiesterase class II)